MIKNDLYPHVFQPLKIRGLTLKNRLEYSPTVVLKCSPEGEVTQEMLDYVAWQADIGVGYVTIGNTPVVHSDSSAWTCELNVTSDRCIHGIELMSRTAREHGAELSIENATSGIVIPFHEGAARYYAEHGVTVPTLEEGGADEQQ